MMSKRIAEFLPSPTNHPSDAGYDCATATFEFPGILDWLETASEPALDRLPFGVVGLSADGIVARYNAAEGNLSGLTPARVIGRNFFTSIAPCTNNFMVAHRFKSEADLDALVDYVFTFRMAPAKVRLRLLKRRGARLMYMLVERREH